MIMEWIIRYIRFNLKASLLWTGGEIGLRHLNLVTMFLVRKLEDGGNAGLACSRHWGRTVKSRWCYFWSGHRVAVCICARTVKLIERALETDEEKEKRNLFLSTETPRLIRQRCSCLSVNLGDFMFWQTATSSFWYVTSLPNTHVAPKNWRVMLVWSLAWMKCPLG